MMDTWDELRCDNGKIKALIVPFQWNWSGLVHRAQRYGCGKRLIEDAYRGTPVGLKPVYAILAAINEELRIRQQPPILIEAILLTSVPSPITNPMEFAKSKLVHDYEGSCVHDAPKHETAVKEGNVRLNLLVKSAESRKILVGEQFHIPKKLYLPIEREDSKTFESRHDELRRKFEPLVKRSEKCPIMVSNECIEVGALATFLSLWDRYKIRMKIDFDDTSGREQILRNNKGTGADFMVTADAPFLLASSGDGIQFSRRTPLHFENQFILVRRLHDVKYDRRNLLVYADSSASEQFIVESLDNQRFTPEYCHSLGELVVKATEMRTGDGIIAWEPLASGLLQSIEGLKKFAEPYKLWLSLFCNTAWIDKTETELVELRVLFEEAFLSEWRYCKDNVSYAEGLLEKDASEVGYTRARFCEKLAIGIGLQKSIEDCKV